MSTFVQKNQQFRTSDLLGLLVLVGLTASGAGVVLAQSFEDNRSVRAKNAAEAFALQIIEQHTRAHAVVTAGRAPASVESSPVLPMSGEIGRDPWGQPFHYRFIQGEAGMKPKVFVWSDGPNRRGESETLVNSVSMSSTKHFAFAGDDVGFVQDNLPDL